MTPLECLSYLLEPAFAELVFIGIATVAALNAIDRIGGQHD